VSEHPITEQMLADKNATGHSIFGPSSAHRWMRCPKSLIAGYLAGDRPTKYAAEGSVAHWLAEDWLTNGDPYKHLGSIHEKDGFEIEITEEMISYVEEYVGWVSTTPGRHYVEVKVDLSAYTPIPSFGTADHIFADRRTLIVTDLKYGKVVVYAEGNPQLRCYAVGSWEELDWLYDFDTVVTRICQPRRDHYDEETISVKTLIEWANDELRPAAIAAWDPDANYQPHPEACEYCPARFTCPALAAVLRQVAASSFDDLDAPVSEETAVAVIEGEIISAPALPEYRQVPLDRLAQIYAWRPVIEKWFRECEEYLTHQLELGQDVPGYKLAKGRAGNRKWTDQKAAVRYLRANVVLPIDLYSQKLASPSEASSLLRLSLGGTIKENNTRIEPFVYQPPGKLTMVPAVDKRPSIASAASAFDDVEDAGNGNSE
jgi:hypothetical protein